MNDKHHIMHYRQEWSLRPEARKIREHPSLVPHIPREIHEDIHKYCPPVPMLGYHALKRTGALWHPQRDTIASMDDLAFAIGEAISDPRTHPLEQQLGRLTIKAMLLQIPFLQDAIIPNERAA